MLIRFSSSSFFLLSSFFFLSSSSSSSFFFFFLLLFPSATLPFFPKRTKTYLCIVRNKILVDVQGEDLLYQIFTSTVLQRVAGQEAPFLEFIQRVCSCETNEDGVCKPIKPGCGGFGIRNFLTLFLSIEVSKAMNDLTEAKLQNDEAGAAMAQHRVGLFTDQLNESSTCCSGI